MKTKLLSTFFFFVAWLVISMNPVMAQCAMCRATVENNVSAGDTSVAAGLNVGILYLFVMPYLMFSVLAFLWYRKSRQHAKKVSLIRHSKS